MVIACAVQTTQGPPVFVYPKATVWAQAETGVWWHLLRSRDWMLQRQMVEDLFGAPRKWCPCMKPSNVNPTISSSLVLLSMWFSHIFSIWFCWYPGGPWWPLVALVVLETIGAPSVRPHVDPLWGQCLPESPHNAGPTCWHWRHPKAHTLQTPFRHPSDTEETWRNLKKPETFWLGWKRSWPYWPLLSHYQQYFPYLIYLWPMQWPTTCVSCVTFGPPDQSDVIWGGPSSTWWLDQGHGVWWE